MYTWISKPLIACLGAVLLAGCDATDSLPFAADFGDLGFGSGTRKVTQVELAGGNVVLTAPNGYCIDRSATRRAAKSGFALIARCDALGVAGYYDVFDLALISVTTAPQTTATSNPTVQDLGRSSAPAKVLEQHSYRGISLVRLDSGSHSIEGVSTEHWRAAFALNGHLVGLALYAPEASPALRRHGMSLLRELTERTRLASVPASAAPKKTVIKPKN